MNGETGGVQASSVPWLGSLADMWWQSRTSLHPHFPVEKESLLPEDRWRVEECVRTLAHEPGTLPQVIVALAVRAPSIEDISFIGSDVVEDAIRHSGHQVIQWLHLESEHADVIQQVMAGVSPRLLGGPIE